MGGESRGFRVRGYVDLCLKIDARAAVESLPWPRCHMQASLSLDLVAKGCDVRGGCQGLGFRGVRHYPVPQSPIPLFLALLSFPV